MELNTRGIKIRWARAIQVTREMGEGIEIPKHLELAERTAQE